MIGTVLSFPVEQGSNANGSWIKLADGLIVQWGTFTVPVLGAYSGGSLDIVLPTSYTGTSYAVQTSLYSSGSYFADSAVTVWSRSLSSINMNYYNNSSGTTPGFAYSWMTVGY